MALSLNEKAVHAAIKVIKKVGLFLKEILLIGSHGQTIFHQPDSIMMDGKGISTLQIGDIGVIAERTGIMTAGDFRTLDYGGWWTRCTFGTVGNLHGE